MMMDREFPSVLFPSFYNSEPPDTALGHCAGSWGTYGQLRPLTPQTSSSTHRFQAQHEATGEVWCHTEPVPVPLFSPKHAVLWPSTPADPLDFSEHLQNFFVDHPSDAFSSAAGLLGDKMHFGGRQQKNAPALQDSIKMKKMNHFMDKLKYQTCPWTLSSTRMDAYSRLLSDAVHSVPVELLAPLLHEELSLQSLDAAFCEANTGGALELVPFPSSTEGAPQSACLVYCANGVDKLTFQQVALRPSAVVSSDEASTFVLKGPVQQISSSSTCGHSCVAVRSLYHCGVWSVSSSQQPHLLQATSSAERVSCVSVSPHVVGELLVASESGAAHLWRLGRGMQLVRSEDSNLYFNGQSAWRWCEFSAHPRVMLYADRTGAELTDIRVQPSSCHTLFRISKGAECRSGERLLLCRYLSPLHSFHHLVTTQYSAYVLDERFPCVPMLKWDHMMDSPPVFCHVLPGSGPSPGAVAKVLLGSQCAQEVMLLQYAGGGAEACVSRGPPQALLRPRDSVERLPAQIPHRTEGSRARLTYSATGLTAVDLKRSASEESFCVLQVLQTGDVFYQILEKASSPNKLWTERPEQRAHLPTSRQAESLSQETTSIWKQWLQKLAKSPEANKSGAATAKTRLYVDKSRTKDLRGRRKAQQDLKESMCAQSLHVDSPGEVVPLRVDVRAEEWSDELSSRLTAGWDGEGAWQGWWAEHLGANTVEKTQALRRKRRREKEARRASGLSLLAMSGSFTSSVSYQSELSDPSDWAGSDTGGAWSQPEDTPTLDTPEKGSSSSLAGTEDRVKPRPMPAATPEALRPRPLLQTPTNERRARRLWSEASQSLGPSTPPSSSSLPASSVTPKPAASSWDAFSWSQSSQRPSQSSQRPSQSSQRPSQSSQSPSQSLQSPSQSLQSPSQSSQRPSQYSQRPSQSLQSPSQSSQSPSQSSQRPSQSSQRPSQYSQSPSQFSQRPSQSSQRPSQSSQRPSQYSQRPSQSLQSPSQSLQSPSQSSQRPSQRPSQSSQPRKKSRMGF